MVAVAITHNAQSIEAAIEQALGHLEIDQLVRGRLVAVKPNETWASAEDISGVRQADTLRGVLSSLRAHSPCELVVSGGAGAAETEDVLRYAGMTQVIEQDGCAFFDHNRPPFTSVDLSYAPEHDVSGPQQAVMVNPRVLEDETLVSVAQRVRQPISDVAPPPGVGGGVVTNRGVPAAAPARVRRALRRSRAED